MKPVLSESGSIELMFGGLCVVGAYFGGAPTLESGILVAVGVGLIAYGLLRRKAWTERLQGHLDENGGPPDQP